MPFIVSYCAAEVPINLDGESLHIEVYLNTGSQKYYISEYRISEILRNENNIEIVNEITIYMSITSSFGLLDPLISSNTRSLLGWTLIFIALLSIGFNLLVIIIE